MTANPDKTLPETVLHPLLLSMAKKFLELYPNMSFEELVLRWGKGSEAVIRGKVEK
jgi:hypothetical protein